MYFKFGILYVSVTSLVYFSSLFSLFSLSGTSIIVILDLLDWSFYVPVFSLLVFLSGKFLEIFLNFIF